MDIRPIRVQCKYGKGPQTGAIWQRVKTFCFVTGPGRPSRDKVCNRDGFLRQGWRDKVHHITMPRDKGLKQHRRDKGL